MIAWLTMIHTATHFKISEHSNSTDIDSGMANILQQYSWKNKMIHHHIY